MCRKGSTNHSIPFQSPISNTIHLRRSPGSSRPATPAPMQPVVSIKDDTSVDSVPIAVNRHLAAFMASQKPEVVVARTPSVSSRKAGTQRKVEFTQGLSQIPSGRDVAIGVGISLTSIQQGIDVEDYVEQRTPRIELGIRRTIECMSNSAKNAQD